MVNILVFLYFRSLFHELSGKWNNSGNARNEEAWSIFWPLDFAFLHTDVWKVIILLILPPKIQINYKVNALQTELANHYIIVTLYYYIL